MYGGKKKKKIHAANKINLCTAKKAKEEKPM